MIDNKTLQFQFTDEKHVTNRESKIVSSQKRQPAFGIKRPVCRCPWTRRLSVLAKPVTAPAARRRRAVGHESLVDRERPRVDDLALNLQQGDTIARHR